MSKCKAVLDSEKITEIRVKAKAQKSGKDNGSDAKVSEPVKPAAVSSLE